MLKKTLTLIITTVIILLMTSRTAVAVPANSQPGQTDQQQVSANTCASLTCNSDFFNAGRDCLDAQDKCECIGHCCLAFDCSSNLGNLVQCRRRCGAVPNRFGKRSAPENYCDKFRCPRDFFEPAWDARNASPTQRNCIAHCCYAFDCRHALGYCRQGCHVDFWVTPMPGR